MTVQSLHLASERAHLLGGSLLLAIIGIALIALAPAKAKENRVTMAEQVQA
jgi:hypothetical protein